MTIPHDLIGEKTIIQLAGTSLKIFARHLGLAVIIYVIFITPLNLIAKAIELKQGAGSAPVRSTSLAFIAMFLAIFSSAIAAQFVGKLVEGRTPTVRQTLADLTGSRLARVIGTLAYVSIVTFSPLLLVMAAVEYIVIPEQNSIAPIFALVSLVLGLISIGYAIVMMINTCFCAYVAIFEDTFYHKALRRSAQLTKGRKWWLVAVFTGALIPLLMPAAVLVFLPAYAGHPARFDSVSGVMRLVAESLVSGLPAIAFYIFQALIYFRRRRELHDLTFFDVSSPGLIRPAFVVLEKRHG
jgi:hypothetical protein